MSKGLRTAALIVGAAALIATGVGAAAGGLASASAAAAAGGGAAGAAAGAAAAAGATAFGISAATLTTIGTIGTIAAGVLSIGAGVLAKKPKASSYVPTGSPQDFVFNPDAPLPMIVGRLASAALVTFKRI